MATHADLDNAAGDLRRESAELGEHKLALRDAMNGLTQALADVKSANDNGDVLNLMPLTAAVDNVTAAVSAATDNGGKHVIESTPPAGTTKK